MSFPSDALRQWYATGQVRNLLKAAKDEMKTLQVPSQIQHSTVHLVPCADLLKHCNNDKNTCELYKPDWQK